MNKKTILATIAIALNSATSGGESQSVIKSGKNHFCGYSISGNTLKNTKNIDSETRNGVQTNKISIIIEAGKKNIPASINISCYTAPPLTTEEPTRAKLEIEKEDSGGRYYRVVNWEKEMHGRNWVATIAYVNSIFGDGHKSAIPDQFLACPKASNNPCFYVNIDPSTPLSKRESMQIKNLIKDISITPQP